MYFLRIIKEGQLQSNNEIKLINQDPEGISIVEIYHLMQKKATKEPVNKTLQSIQLPDVLKIRFQKLLETIKKINLLF